MMKTIRSFPLALLLIAALVSTSAFAQQQPPDSGMAEPQQRTPAPGRQPAPGMQPGMQETPMMQDQQGPDWEHMASAMTSMAETCQTMMKMEMANYPLKVGAVIGGGVLLAIALVLFIILEIQWIRLLGLRIRAAKRAEP